MENVKDILAAGAALSVSQVPKHDGDAGYVVPYVALPDGYKVHDLEKLFPLPTRKRAQIALLDANSFVAYVKEQGSLASCRLYANVDYEASLCNIVAIMDDHGDDPAWREHKATFNPKQAIEWKRWAEKNGTQMPQALFAAFIEDNIGDIRSVSGSPSGTDMLEMALAFEATSEKRFKRRIDLQAGGVQLEYIDKADDSTSQKFRMFERFTVGVPVFQGSTDAYPIEARLKFRQNNDQLVFWYELIRPDKVFKQAVTDELGKIKEGTGFPLYYGTP